MRFAKKVAALVLTGSLLLGSSAAAFAADGTGEALSSPTTPSAFGGATSDSTTKIGKTESLEENSDGSATLVKVITDDPTLEKSEVLRVGTSKSDKDGEELQVTKIGSKALEGSQVARLYVVTGADKFTFAEDATTGAKKLTKVSINTAGKTKVTLKKNALGETVKKVVLKGVKSKNLVLKKGAFAELGKSVKIVLKGYTKKERKAFKKKIKKAGFKGKIIFR